MHMHNPPHPGETLKELYLEPMGLNVSDAAKKLNMTRPALSEIVNGRRSITTKTAIKLGKAFNCSAETWLKMQLSYDLWQEQQNYKADDVEVIVAA